MDQFHHTSPAIPFPFPTPSYATINRIFSITYLEKYEQTHRNINEKREKKKKMEQLYHSRLAIHPSHPPSSSLPLPPYTV